ncbi:MAG: hypothetical protein JWR16_1207 [Nevskia sp.]|nr:hypothetical protein [Nevskia sp.]
MSSIIRATSKPKNSVMLPSGASVKPANSPQRELAADRLREIVRETHEELAAATATDAIGSIVAADAPAVRPSPEATLASEREKARSEGFARGHAEGLSKGQQAAAQEWRAQLEDLDLLVESFQKEREELMPKLEDDLVAVAFEAVMAILGESAVSKHVIQEAVRKAAAGVASDSPITIRVSQVQLAQLSNAEDLSFIGKRKGAVEWVEDIRVELGGCIVETGRGTLDARLETQVDRLRKALLAARMQT